MNKKHKFIALRWIVFGLICISLLVIDITQVLVYYKYIDQRPFTFSVVVSFAVLMVTSIATFVLLAVIQCKLYNIITQTEATRKSINCVFITMQTIGLILYISQCFAQMVLSLNRFFEHIQPYDQVKLAAIFEICGAVIKLYNISILALVIYKSS